MATDVKRKRSGSTGGYTIRRLRPADREAFRSLYELVFGRSVSAEWFDWKYADNPHFDPVPAFVAESDGRLVGARPFLALPIRAGAESYTALQPADAMVHPEHRRRGLFTAMTERALDWLADRSPRGAFCFNFPNERSLPADLKLGWRTVGTVPTHYRLERPDAILGTTRALGGLARLAGQGFLRGVEALGRSPPDVPISRRKGVPAATLASIYNRHVPAELHVHRSEALYRWRFADPNWEYKTYLAGPPDAPIAALVAGRGERDGIDTVRVVEAVPLLAGCKATTALAALLAALVEDTDAALIATLEGTLPRSALRAQGFLRDDRPPLSIASRPTTMVARPIGTGDWTVGGRDLLDLADWRPSFVERDG